MLQQYDELLACEKLGSLDEVQFMFRFEEVLNSLLRISNIDVYVTGSNSKFLSSDLQVAQFSVERQKAEYLKNIFFLMQIV